MRKIEYIWRELLYKTIQERKPEFTLTELAVKFKLSTSVVSHALKSLRDLQIVRIGKTRSEIIDMERLLFFWATKRNLDKDIIYKTFAQGSIREIESSMPAEVVPTAFSACKTLYHLEPSDYDTVYYYAQDLKDLIKRFPFSDRSPANIYILKPDPFLWRNRQVTMAQVFCDLWNIPKWYAREFSHGLLSQIKGELGL